MGRLKKMMRDTTTRDGTIDRVHNHGNPMLSLFSQTTTPPTNKYTNIKTPLFGGGGGGGGGDLQQVTTNDFVSSGKPVHSKEGEQSSPPSRPKAFES
jgi:hypothetical protein